MKVGVVANSIEHYRYSWPSMARGIESAGHSLVFGAGDSGLVDGYLPVENVPGITRRPSLQIISARNGLREWSNRNDLDAIIVNNAVPATAVRLFRQGELPVVYFAHGLHWGSDSERASAHWRLIERMMLGRTDAAIVLNSDDQRWFNTVSPKLPVLRLHYGVGVDLEKFPRKPIENSADASKALNLLWVGEFNSRKRPHKAIDMIDHLRFLGVNCRLNMLGEGSLLSNSKAYAEKLGVARQIGFHGKTDPRPYYQQSHALIHTATWEGFPRVFLEAMATGRKIFSFDIKGARDIQGVQLIDNGDAQAFAEVVAEWWTSGGQMDSQIDRRLLSSETAGVAIGDFLGDLSK